MSETSTKLLAKGLYDFDADHAQVRVFKGTAEVAAKSQNIKVTGELELALNTGGKLKAQGFDTRQYEDDFFRWGALRSGYLSEASVDAARVNVGIGPGWYGPGWYWRGRWYPSPFEPIFNSPVAPRAS